MEKNFYEIHRSEAIQVLLLSGKERAPRVHTNLKLAELLEEYFPAKKRMYIVKEDNIDLKGNIITARTF